MVDRTEEDILQDNAIADLQAQVLALKADLARLAPLQGLAERVAEIEAFFERQGLKAFPERKV